MIMKAEELSEMFKDEEFIAQYLEKNADDAAEMMASFSITSEWAQKHGYDLVMRMPSPNDGLSSTLALIPKGMPVAFTSMADVCKFLLGREGVDADKILAKCKLEGELA